MGNLIEYSSTSIPYDFRNKIINGGMVIDQRSNGGTFSIKSDQARLYTLDRWYTTSAFVTGDSNFSLTAGFAQTPGLGSNDTRYAITRKSTDTPDDFSHCIHLQTTSSVPISSSTIPYWYQHYSICQDVEYDYLLRDLNYGTPKAKNITISFWVKTTKPGIYGGLWYYRYDGGNANNEYISLYKFPYTINAALTWEHKMITIPGNTDYKPNGKNGKLATLEFVIGSTAAERSSAGVNSWDSKQQSFLNQPAGQIVPSAGGTLIQRAVPGSEYFLDTAGQSSFFITGVQLETRATSTPFEWRPITSELQLCHRYYCQPHAKFTHASQSSPVRQTYHYPSVMRVVPSVSAENYYNNEIDRVSTESVRVLAASPGGDNSQPIHNTIYYMDAEI